MGESEARIITHSSQRVTAKRHLKEQFRRLQALDRISLPITGSAAENLPVKSHLGPAFTKQRRKPPGRPPDRSVEHRREVMRTVPKKISLVDFCTALDKVRLAVPDWPGKPGSWHQAWEDPLLRPRIKSMRVSAYATAKNRYKKYKN